MEHQNKCRECIAIRLMPDYMQPKVCPLCKKSINNAHI